MSTRNIATSLEELPQCWPKRRRVSLTGDQAKLSVGRRFACHLWNIASVAGFGRDDCATAGFHCPLQPFDGFINPSVVLLGIGDRLFPKCICLNEGTPFCGPRGSPRSGGSAPVASFMIGEPASLT
ncbi:hypothetical protein [Bradyrhizobium shewense]|uniref:hypothetical protein n=1 Tax=Bradyrhizobium shewense TaxID=1761772 RepID=UPI0013F62C99|nr:hypothetical protein [Bradyrhizobium shewense]